MSGFASAIYEGRVEHARSVPRPHAFSYRLFFLYLDLDELDGTLARPWFLSLERANLASFRRADYLGRGDRPLRDEVLDRVEEELGRRPSGAVRMLTHVRTLGYVFNPVTFYFCHDDAGGLDAIVAEITNTPWRERHAYVLDARTAERRGDGDAARLVWRFDKAFHVSPFWDMDHVYEWSFSQVGDSVDVHMANRAEGEVVFTAGFVGERREWSTRNLALALLRHPFHTFRVHLAIYWQAARLWLKRTPFFAHPSKRVAAGDAVAR
ncbi:MAG: DUF1365 domain-containing protein [Planctomycetota bacterium]